MTDWQVRIQEDWPMFGHKILVSRWVLRLDAPVMEVLGPDGIVSPLEEGVAPPAEKLWHLPSGALESMRDEIDRTLGRRYDEQLVDEVRSSLAIERARVDKVIDNHLDIAKRETNR